MQSTQNQNKIWLLTLSLLTLLSLRFLPLLYASFANYGYDYGFYLFAVKHSQNLPIKSFFSALWGGYNNPLFYIANWLHIPPSITLNETYFISAILSGLCFYFVFAKKNWQAGIFACLLFSTSLIQAEMYSMFLWKNVLAVPLLLLGFKFLEEKRWQLFILMSGLLLIIHRTTAIVYFATIFLYFVYTLIQEKKYKVLGWLASASVLLIVGAFYFIGLKSQIYNLLYNGNFYVRTGLFLEGQNLFFILWPFLLLSLPGIWLYLKNKNNPLWPIFMGICLLWIAFHLPFYRRILIYLDISVIYFSAYFLGQLDFKSWLTKTVVILIFGFLIFRAQDFIRSRPIWISFQEIAEIKNFKPKNLGDFVLSLSANDGPWILGYADNIRLGAPGLFEDRQTKEEWMAFWQGENIPLFLTRYPRPLYIYQRSYITPYIPAECLKYISPSFSEYICK